MFARMSTLLSAATLLTLATAQTSVPSDLSSGFDTQAIQVQVSYNGNAFDGFTDGSTLTTQGQYPHDRLSSWLIRCSETSNVPTFALGDASGVNTAVTFLILMVDTTDTNNRVLHFLQTGFKANGDKTGISSSSQPTVAYTKPGGFGETGTHQYSFLMYQQTSGNSITGLPQSGQKFEVAGFQSANGLKPAEAGVAMSVDMGGGGGGQQTTNAASQASLAPPASTQTAGGQASSAASKNAGTTAAAGNGSASSSIIVTFQSPIINNGTSTATAAPTTVTSTAVGSAGPTTLATTGLAGAPSGGAGATATTGSATTQSSAAAVANGPQFALGALALAAVLI